MRTTKLSNVARGKAFKIGDVEFIKLADVNGGTFVTTKNIVFKSEFGEDNNLTTSTVLRRLKDEFLPKIIARIGDENVLEFDTDLTALDGLKPYSVLKSKISLPTLDFYRQNVEVFDRHKLNDWWWLATPESAEQHGSSCWIVCVAPSGYISNYGCDNINRGVRPFLCFVSSISVSCED